MKEVVDFSAGIQDRDVDERYIEKGKYRILRNGRILDAVGSHAGSITSVKGTREIFDETTLCSFGFTPIAVEAYEDKLYVFYARDTRGNVIMEYDTQTLEKHLIFIDYDITVQTPALLRCFLDLMDSTAVNNTYSQFHRQTHITADSDVFMHVYRGLLYFHDREGDPYKINIDKSRADLNYYVTDTEYIPDCITVVKAPPEYPLAEKTEATDANQDTTRSNDQLGSFNSGLYSFAQRFEYEDGEISAVSTFYPCPVIPNIDDEDSGDSTDLFNTYGCSLSFDYVELSQDNEELDPDDPESTEDTEDTEDEGDEGDAFIQNVTYTTRGCYFLKINCISNSLTYYNELYSVSKLTFFNGEIYWDDAKGERHTITLPFDDPTAFNAMATYVKREKASADYSAGVYYNPPTLTPYEDDVGDTHYKWVGSIGLFGSNRNEDVVVTSFCASAKTDDKGNQKAIFAFTIETNIYRSSFENGDESDTPPTTYRIINASVADKYPHGYLFIYDESDEKLYWNGDKNWTTCYINRQGDVFAMTARNSNYYAHKLEVRSNSGEKYLRQIQKFAGASECHNKKRMQSFASDASGTIVYAVYGKKTTAELYCSTSQGEANTFDVVADVSVMFADVIQSINANNEANDKLGLGVCCSADGLIVYVAKCGCVACTKDGGVTWNSYVVDDDADYKGILSIDCSADGRMVYVVMGTLGNGGKDIQYPDYAGIMYNSSNYARTWEMTQCDPRYWRGWYVTDRDFIYALSSENLYEHSLLETPTRMRNVTCNDKGDVVLGAGITWVNYTGYTDLDGKKETSLTSYPLLNWDSGTHYERSRTAPDTLYMSVDYGNTSFALTPTSFVFESEGTASAEYKVNLLGAILSPHSGFMAYSYNSSTGKWSYTYNSTYRRRNFEYTIPAFVPKDYVSNDIKTTKIKNNLVEALLRYNTGDKHVHRIHLLMEHGGTIFKIHDILRSDVTSGSENEVLDYTFVNTGLYSALASKDANKLFDNVPRNCLSSTIEQDALFFGGYTDGRDLVSMHGAVVEINNETYEHGNISLKCGQAYRYGIIFYDDYNRSTAVCEIGTAVARAIADSEQNESGGYNKRRVAKITIPTTITPPEWATKFKFCRSKMTNNYYCINGFDGTKAYGNRICLDITTQTDIVPDIGDTIELVYEFETENETKRLTLPIVGYIDNKSGVYWGVGEGTDAILGQGRWAVVSDNEEQRYNLTAVQGGTEYFTSSYFYLNKPQDIVGDVSYYEIPYTFAIDRDNRAWSGTHSPFGEEIYIGEHEKRNDSTDPSRPLRAPVRAIEKNDSGVTTGVSYTLYDDGDVIIMAHPARELSLLEDNSRWTTLGRPNLAIENYKEEERVAGVCVSERYVYDTHYNGLSSFNTALINYKDLDHRYGSIEAIGFLHDALCIYQKYRLSMLQYRKQTLSTARDEGIVTSTQDIFGEQSFFAEEYGLTDHHSLTTWGNARYFADQQRGKVLRVSTNGIYPISEYGMRQHFFNTLAGYTGKMLACFSPEHMSYMIIHEDEEGNIKADNFYETGNGWSGEFEMNPDLITNTHNGVYSIKDGLVYKNDVEAEPIIFGEEVETIIRIPFHEYIDSIKTYNAIQIEGNKAPSKAVFESDSGESTIGAYNFEHREAQWTAPLPMAGDVKGSQPRYLGYLEQNDYATRSDDGYYYHTYTLPYKVFGLHLGDRIQLCEKGDDGKLHPHSHYGNEEYIIVGREGLTLTLRSDASRLPYHTYLVAFDLSQVNGATHKGKSLMAELHFKGETLVKSLMIDIDESKI